MPRKELRPPATHPPEFYVDFTRVTTAVRGALSALLGKFGGESTVALALSRELGIDKTLAWRVVRLARAQDPYEAVAHIPGPAGCRILLESFGRHGVDAAALAALERAFEAFEAMVQTHAGDRPTLDLILASSAPERMDGKQLEAGRRKAFRGNSAVWGVQARVRYLTRAVAPSLANPELADVASIAGFRDFRRLRPVTGWPLLHLYTRTDAREDTAHDPMVPTPRDEPPVLEEFSSSALPRFGAQHEGVDSYFTLPEGPVGNAGTFSCSFGWFDRQVGPLQGDLPDDVAENSVICNTPVEVLQFDLFIHRDVRLTAPPSVRLQGEMPGPLIQLASRSPDRDLPLAERVLDLGDPTRASSPHVPDYPRIAERVCTSLERPLAEFRGFRVVMRYPSVPTRLVMTFPLAPPA